MKSDSATLNPSAESVLPTYVPTPAALLSEALVRLGAKVGLVLARLDVDRSRDTCVGHGVNAENFEHSLGRVGEAVGLRLRRVSLSCQELTHGAGDGLFPLLLPTLDGESGLTLILERRRSKVCVESLVSGERTFLDAAALSRHIDVGSGEPAVWLCAERAEKLVGQAGNAAHEGGHGHDVPPHRRLLAMLALERSDLGVVVVYAIGVGLLSLATPLGVQFLVNTVAYGALVQPLLVLTLLVLAGLLLAGLLRALKAWVIESIQQRLFIRVAMDAAYRLPRVRADALDGEHGPELVNRFFDVVTLQKGAATLLSDAVSVILATVMGMIVLGFYHPYLLAFDVFLVLGICFVVFFLGVGATPTAIKESKYKYAMAAWLEEVARHRSTLGLADAAFVDERAESLALGWLSARRKHFKVVFRQFVGALALQAVASAILLGAGGWLVIARQLTLGQLVAAELIVSSVVLGVTKLGKSFESYYDLLAAADKLGHLTDLPLCRGSGMEVDNVRRGVALELTSVSVTRRDKAVVCDVNLKVDAGDRAVLFAPGGGGKSTLVDVLAGLREPSAGDVTIDGLPMREFAPASIANVVRIVRGPEIFEGTLFENVSLGRGEVSRVLALEALEAVGLADLLSGMPDGLDTRVPTDAALLGATNVQLLTLARAIAQRPRLLVLDGALDALGDEARAVAWEAVARPDRPWTLLVTTARPEIYELASRARRFTLGNTPSHSEVNA